jgi:hypothetical protein
VWLVLTENRRFPCELAATSAGGTSGWLVSAQAATVRIATPATSPFMRAYIYFPLLTWYVLRPAPDRSGRAAPPMWGRVGPNLGARCLPRKCSWPVFDKMYEVDRSCPGGLPLQM